MTTASALAFAEAIAEPGTRALLVDQENQGKGWVSIAQAVDSGQAYAVAPRNGIVALDLDTPDLYASAQAALPALRAERCNVVQVASGQSTDGFEHRHMWVIAPVWLDSGDVRGLLAEHGLRGQAVRFGQPTRPPLSPHRDGQTRARLLDPERPEIALGSFKRPHGKALSDHTRRMLSDLDTERGPCGGKTRLGVPSREAAQRAIVTDWVYAELPFDGLVKALLDPRNKGGVKLQQMPPDGARQRIRKLYDEQLEWLRANPPNGEGYTELRETLQTALAQAAHLPFPAKTADVDHAVLTQLLQIAADCLNVQPSASDRRLARDLSLDRHTIRAALRRLEDSGLITIQPATAPGQADSCRLHLEHLKTLVPSPNRTPTYRGANGFLIGPNSHGFRDVFSNGTGLGLGARNTWLALQPHQQLTTVEVAGRRIPQVSRSAVLGQLRKLDSHALAARKGNRWTQITPTPKHLSNLADQLGVAGKTQRREARMDKEQQHYADLGKPTRPRKEPGR